MRMDENNPLITSEMFASKIEELRSAVSGLEGDELTRAYHAVSAIAKTPHLYDVQDGLRFGDSSNFFIQTEIAGPVPEAPKAGSIPILMPRVIPDFGTINLGGPLPIVKTGVSA